MKKAILVLTSVLFAVLVLTCASTGGGGGGGGGDRGGFAGGWAWGVFTDASSGGSSTITLIEDVEMIDGEPQMTYTITGEITSQYEYGYCGWYARPDDETLEKLLTCKSFSFKVIADGAPYQAMFTTSDIEDACYYRSTFNTKKDQEQVISIKVGSLQQPDDWGIKKKFSQELADQVQWQTTNNGRPGTFSLKIWDLRVHD